MSGPVTKRPRSIANPRKPRRARSSSAIGSHWTVILQPPSGRPAAAFLYDMARARLRPSANTSASVSPRSCLRNPPARSACSPLFRPRTEEWENSATRMPSRFSTIIVVI